MPADRVTRSSTRSIKKQTYYDDALEILSDSDDDEVINKRKSIRRAQKPKKAPPQMKTPSRRRIKRKTDSSSENESDESDRTQGTPPKQRKQQQQGRQQSVDDLFSPSRLIGRLSIDDSESDDEEQSPIHTPQVKNKYQSAKLSLACTETNYLPGREDEIKQLCDFMLEHLENSKSGSLYVSGQPGTGKTACLSNILENESFAKKFTKLYINCTSVSSAGNIYKKICTELKLKTDGKTEKDCLNAIEKCITGTRKMVLLVLDEIDQLIGHKQSVLYTIFEWPSKPKAQILIIGIANSLDLTDRLLTRLNSKCCLKPRLLHFAPYTKQQIVDIFKSRLENAGVTDIFPAVTIQLLAAKIAAISGDVRKALDIGRRVIEIAEQHRDNKNAKNLSEFSIDGVSPLEDEEETAVQPVQVKEVVDVLSNVYGASQRLNSDIEDTFPLQQKIMICTLMLMLKKSKNKDITIGRLHDVYKRICQKRNILAIDQAEFVGLCSLVETRGIIRIGGKKEPRLNKVFLQWDDEEVTAALKDKQLIAGILDDVSCLGR